MNDEWTCDTCAYRYVKIYAEPCTNCIDGNKYKPKESEDAE